MLKSYHLLPWLLEWKMPTQTARSSPYKALRPVWVKQLRNHGSDMCQVLQPNRLGSGTAVHTRHHRPGYLHTCSQAGRHDRASAPASALFWHLPQCCQLSLLKSQLSLCCHPLPSHQLATSDLLWAGDRMKRRPSVVLQVSKRSASALSAGPHHSPWGRHASPSCVTLRRPLSPCFPRV